jgi:hypothetical protein
MIWDGFLGELQINETDRAIHLDPHFNQWTWRMQWNARPRDMDEEKIGPSVGVQEYEEGEYVIQHKGHGQPASNVLSGVRNRASCPARCPTPMPIRS